MAAPIRYNSVPALRQPSQFVRSMITDLVASRELGWRLFLRDLKAKYRASILGYLWLLLPPLVVTATFLLLQKAKVMNPGDLPVSYPLYILAGSTFWQLFADAAQTPMRLVNQSKSMLVKINFPREALIMAAALECLFSFCIRIAILYAYLPIFDLPPDTMGAGLFLAPISALGLLVAGLALGVLLTPFSILFQDFSQGVPLLLSLWLMATPVAYAASPSNGLLSTINRFNPISSLVELPRSLALNLETTALNACLVTTCFTLLLTLIAWALFRIALPHLISRIGS